MSKMKEPIGVVGGGSFGTTLSHLVASGGRPTLQWMRDSETAREIAEERTNSRYLGERILAAGIETTTDLQEVAERCRMILLVVPSSAFRKVARSLGDFVKGDQLIVSGTKGLERKSYSRMTEIIRQETCCRKVGAISGPNLALELLAGMPGATVAGSRYDEVVALTQAALKGPSLRVYGNNDLIGVELGGALKNIPAIASGMLSGMGYGENTKSMMLTRSLAEMGRLGERMGAQAETFSGLSGIGDLITTAMSRLSRNFRVGEALGKGATTEEAVESVAQVAEGVQTTRVAFEWAREHDVYAPITLAMYRVLYEELTPEDAMKGLMALPSVYEGDPGPNGR